MYLVQRRSHVWRTWPACYVPHQVSSVNLLSTSDPSGRQIRACLVHLLLNPYLIYHSTNYQSLPYSPLQMCEVCGVHECACVDPCRAQVSPCGADVICPLLSARIPLSSILHLHFDKVCWTNVCKFSCFGMRTILQIKTKQISIFICNLVRTKVFSSAHKMVE